MIPSARVPGVGAAQGSSWEAAGGVDGTTGRGAPLCCITQPLGRSFLDPRSRFPIVPKTGWLLLKTSSLSSLYTQRAVYQKSPLRGPQLRIKKPKLSKGIFTYFFILLFMKNGSILMGSL